MNKLLAVISLVFLISINGFAKVISKQPDYSTKPNISFTENKGQVHDQFGKQRPDVLYGVMAGDLAVHIRNAGISYQLYIPGTYREVEDITTKEKQLVPDQYNIYRIDLNWLNCNVHSKKSEDETLPGYNNYYTDNCPDGTLNVRSYKGINLNDLYKGINLHYYEKNGNLKHDYLVSAHADYKQIRIQVKGADIKVNKDGSLLLITPLGTVHEGAPLVYQAGKQIRSRWKVENSILSFEIEKYDPNLTLIIDPVTRVWGTYYGGIGVDQGTSTATDVDGNVYMAGSTNSNMGTVIATSGSHQSQAGGSDGFLTKFDHTGARLWGTYYGGTVGGGSERFESCTTDTFGNVYASGITNTYVNPTVIATPGSHQPNFSGQNNNDAFLVKFNSAGVRLWGTYYGGTQNEIGHCCVTDLTGNVYMAGRTQSSSNISTPGSHMQSYSWGLDAFLVKFNSNGVRQWATYYGSSSGDDFARSCATDANGNIFIAGWSNSTGSIATFGCHQNIFGGSGNLYDAFLVKFNANGVRQWGTYYGGSGMDYASSCATDAAGNIYLAGTADSYTNTIIATVGSHQAASIGASDAFLAKFDGNGVRLWGTYYGGASSETGNDCTTDASGNVYLTGGTSSGSSTLIADASSHQNTFGGGSDAFLAKFDANGVRQWGTYYGGPQSEQGESCAADLFGHVYLTGGCNTSTGTVIANLNGHQSIYGGGIVDAFLAKFDACVNAPAQPSVINGPTIVCQGYLTSYTTPLAQGASFYTLSIPGGSQVSGYSNTISVTPVASGDFTLIVGNSCGVSPHQTVNVTVNVSPTVTVNNGTICAGQSFSILPGGAVNYTYSGGPVVSPNVTTTYSVTGTNSFGCSNTAFATISVNALPIISVNSGTICEGKSFTLVASGALNYTFLPVGPVVTPNSSTTYSVIGEDGFGCISSLTAISNLHVNYLPIISSTTTSSLLCVGEQAILIAAGAVNYTFNPGGAVGSIIVSPETTTTYTLTGTDANGCSNTAVITQSVDACTSIPSSGGDEVPLSVVEVFPNPTTGIINLKLNADNKITILNTIGQIVYSSKLEAGEHKINLEALAKGVYVVKFEGFSKSIKLIKE